MKLHKKKMDIYPVTFYFSLDAEKVSLKGNFTIPDGCGGCCYYDGLNVYMWMDSKDFTVLIPDLVHECMHAAMFTADIVGLRPTLESNESVAYLAGWYSARVLDFVNIDSRSGEKK